jgi:hypothetical protein
MTIDGGSMGEPGVELTPQQVNLLSAIVEASKAQRQEFFVLRAENMGGVLLRHPGLPGPQFMVYPPDLQALEDLGFLTVTEHDSRTGKTLTFDVSPSGRYAYTILHTQAVSPVEAIEDEMRRFIDSGSLGRAHPAAFDPFSAAASLLWAEAADGQLTEIGHYCREALQEFVEDLVKGLLFYGETKKTDTIKRLRALLEAQRGRVGARATDMMQALVAYWGAVSDLAQRQEHAGMREGERLRWEDARRLVFQTLVVMYEIDRFVGHE